ncbi:VIT1/CCC1 transporter family protein [Candidatus Woesearchaeota archaeon]|nr:VIT1/CCC1 transporter family protein [Candidatus Woesearchaeota archaeon]
MKRGLHKKEFHGNGSAVIRDVILGGQDGLVNVLGIVLAVAEATNSRSVILISGLAATFAESISMAAVAYTSSKASKEYYDRQLAMEWQEVREKPAEEVAEVRALYAKKGFKGSLLNQIVKTITSNKKVWVQTMMRDELGLSEDEFAHPVRDALVVGFAAIIGSLIPLIPFILLPIPIAVVTTLGVSTLVLFGSGAIKANYTGTTPWKSGLEMALVGMTAAIAGYLIGKALGVLPL